jgi:hypothetical protein
VNRERRRQLIVEIDDYREELALNSLKQVNPLISVGNGKNRLKTKAKS